MTVQGAVLVLFASVCLALVGYYVADGLGLKSAASVAVLVGVATVVFFSPRTKIRW